MASLDSIVIGEDWISEHYFTTDSAKESFHGKVLELRKLWDAEKKEGRTTVRDGLLAAAGALQTVLAGLAESPDTAREAHALTRVTFGYPAALSTFTAERAGSELEIPDAKLDGTTSVLFLQAVPVAAIEDLLDPETGVLIVPAIEDGKPIESVSTAVSAAFRSDAPPAFMVVQAGQWLLLAEAERWAEGRYLAVDLLVVAERRHEAKGGEIDRVAAMFGKQALLPDADGNIWWTGVLEESVKHTVGVSKDLREGIRLSIEIIANDVVKRRSAMGLTLEGIDGQELAKHSLRFLYRILFLLYAEASPEMRVLPTGAAEYQEGYGLDRLRELTLVELTSGQARDGTHLYESLATLFRLVDIGHIPAPRNENRDDPAPGLEFQPLRADLFRPESTLLIDEVGLGNEATQQVLEHLLLTQESKGRKGADRGFVSYAELGINQLGAVYEGLMSYTGFFAEEDLYEVAKSLDKDGKPDKGSWVVPVTRADHLPPKHFVPDPEDTSGQGKPAIHPKGTFVFRLAGRERQQSASYYTSDLMTKFVVSQALEELLDQGNERTTPEQVLQLSICEPALGSGAFAIEAVRQLAAEYLKRKQEDLGKLIDADQYPVELQKVKAHIALHQVYGVDLNATAVELAEVSLWLDTMVAGLQAPWFGLHLRRGNSLIGAQRSVYAPSRLSKKQWLKIPSTDVPLGEAIGAGIHHFLLPSEGWGAVIDTLEAKTYAPEKREKLRLWRTEIRKSPSKPIVKRLQALAQRVETLWEITLRRLTIAESEIRRDIHLWGTDPVGPTSGVTREEIEAVLGNLNGGYRRLRRVMDAWCAMWSWPLTADVEPPTWDEWVSGLEALLGISPREGRFEKYGQTSLAGDLDWHELDIAEDTDRAFARAMSIDTALRTYPWLTIAAKTADSQGYFHWTLDFAPVFARGGFDLQVGNPPWVRPDWDQAGTFAEFDPIWKLASTNVAESGPSSSKALMSNPSISTSVLLERSTQAGGSEYLGSEVKWPLLDGVRTDLYPCFISATWANQKENGVVALIHPEGHLVNEDSKEIRRQAYRRLRRHWHFRNEKKLFDIDNNKEFGVHIYSGEREPHFLQASSLFTPETAERSLIHDGAGEVPGIKNRDGEWDTRPHRRRIFQVDRGMLDKWAQIRAIDGGEPVEHTAMCYMVNDTVLEVLLRLGRHPRAGRLSNKAVYGWNETTDEKNKNIALKVITPTTWEDVILQGPHISPGNPLNKHPNPTLRSNRDWSPIDHLSTTVDFIPRTKYILNKPRRELMNAYPRPGGVDTTTHYRLAWREFVTQKAERTLQAAIIPPGPTHLYTIYSYCFKQQADLVAAAGLWSSIVSDFLIKVSTSGHINGSAVDRIPHIKSHALSRNLALRALRLNCLTKEFSALWESSFDPEWAEDTWTPSFASRYPHFAEIGAVKNKWSIDTPLRSQLERRQALIEIDAISAIILGVSSEELSTIFRTQFPTLQDNDRSLVFDSNGRTLPAKLASKHKNGARIQSTELTACGITYQEPFVVVDREREMGLAYKHFSESGSSTLGTKYSQETYE
ncbi:class I SAM-dependent DNA methyltransferase [Gordonia sp. Swx-4]|uniref:Eco57I restriction-modification methylase domain-containing protein n=1 Tax=Gordonia sp. Swx-4 TaxID=3029399 RepID=UPI0025743CBA|nr:DNA methyltransferase [Gordonia sp. Swx-4]WJG11405.1 class I SAM-dependent DNA methyltransferase [Gordonia sp. Swx-4]